VHPPATPFRRVDHPVRSRPGASRRTALRRSPHPRCPAGLTPRRGRSGPGHFAAHLLEHKPAGAPRLSPARESPWRVFPAKLHGHEPGAVRCAPVTGGHKE
jgi:hypothetical protein